MDSPRGGFARMSVCCVRVWEGGGGDSCALATGTFGVYAYIASLPGTRTARASIRLSIYLIYLT